MIALPPGTTQISVVGKLVDASGLIIASKSNGSFQTPVTIATNANTGMAFGTLTLATLASGTASFSAGGIVYLGSGDYRLDFTCSGSPQSIVISAEGTLGSFLTETVLITNSASDYFGTNVLALNGSAPPAATLSLITNDTNGWLKVSPQLNGNTAPTAAQIFATPFSAFTTSGSIGAVLASWVNATDSAAATAHFLALSAAITLPTGYTITVQSPIISSSSVELVRGDDYLANDSRSLDFTFTSLPSIAGGTVTFNSRNLTVRGTVLSATSARFEIRSTQTSQLVSGSSPFTIVAVLSDGSICTLIRGSLNVVVLP